MRLSVRAFSGNIRGEFFIISVLFNLFLLLPPPHEPRRGEDERHADRDAPTRGAVEERAVLRHAGGEVRCPGPGDQEGDGFAVLLIPPDGEECDGGDEEQGAEGPEQSGEGRAAADDPGGDVVDLPPDRDCGGAVDGVLVQEEGEADACAESVADREDGERGEEAGSEGLIPGKGYNRQ